MKIKTGLAAFGLSGQIFHAPFIEAHPDFELTAVAERSKKSAQATYPDVESVDSFEELLRCDVELIVVNTPDATHYPLCRAALEAGKHVIVEKPFVTTIREAKELIEIADRKGLMLITYQNRRWDGDFLTLQQIVRQGSLGRLVEIQSSFQRYRPRLGQSAWKETPGATRVGITYNLCSHLCDQIVALLGKPEGVWATLDRQRDGSRSDDRIARQGYWFRGCSPRCYLSCLFLSRSRISVSNCTSAGGAAGAGVSSFFFSCNLLNRRISRKIENEIIRKSNVVCRKLP